MYVVSTYIYEGWSRLWILGRLKMIWIYYFWVSIILYFRFALIICRFLNRCVSLIGIRRLWVVHRTDTVTISISHLYSSVNPYSIGFAICFTYRNYSNSCKWLFQYSFLCWYNSDITKYTCCEFFFVFLMCFAWKNLHIVMV